MVKKVIIHNNKNNLKLLYFEYTRDFVRLSTLRRSSFNTRISWYVIRYCALTIYGILFFFTSTLFIFIFVEYEKSFSLFFSKNQFGLACDQHLQVICLQDNWWGYEQIANITICQVQYTSTISWVNTQKRLLGSKIIIKNCVCCKNHYENRQVKKIGVEYITSVFTNTNKAVNKSFSWRLIDHNTCSSISISMLVA